MTSDYDYLTSAWKAVVITAESWSHYLVSNDGDDDDGCCDDVGGGGNGVKGVQQPLSVVTVARWPRTMEGRTLHLRPGSEWMMDSLGLVMLIMRFMMMIIRMMMTMMKNPDARMIVPFSAITRIGGEFVLENDSSSSLFWPEWSLWSCDDWLSLWTLQPARSAEPALVVKLLWYVGTLEGAKAWIVEIWVFANFFGKTKHFLASGIFDKEIIIIWKRWTFIVRIESKLWETDSFKNHPRRHQELWQLALWTFSL